MKKLISEDNTMYNVQRQQSGSTARQDSKGETAPQPNQVKNLMHANKRDDNSQAPFLKPYPLNLGDEILADLFLATVNLKKIIDNTFANPTLKQKYMQDLKSINDKLIVIHKNAVEISRQLDKIT